MKQGLLLGYLFALLALGSGAAARGPDAPAPTLDAGEFQKRIADWTATHYGELNIDPSASMETLESRAARGDADAYSQMAERADMQEHQALAYDLSLKAIALGLTRPATLFMGLNEVDYQSPPEASQMARWESIREHDLAWYLVAAIRGDEDGARVAKTEIDPDRFMHPNPLTAPQVDSVCRLAVQDYQRVQTVRIALGRSPFSDVDNLPLTAFWAEENPWPISICGELPLPEMHCRVVTLTGPALSGKSKPRDPRLKPFLCTASGLVATARRIPLLVATPVAPQETRTPTAAPGPVTVMRTVTPDTNWDELERAPQQPNNLDSGSDSDPGLRYHFRSGKAVYVIASSSEGIQGIGAAKRSFMVPANPIYVLGPLYYSEYHGDLLLLYRSGMPGDDAAAQETTGDTYLLRLKPGDLSLAWNNSGIPAGAAPALIAGSTAYVGADGFLGAVDLDTGTFRWCLRDLKLATGDVLRHVSTPKWNPHQVEFDSAPEKDGADHYVKVDLESLKVTGDLGTTAPSTVATDCPVFR